MGKRYRVKVNGEVFEVEIDELDSASGPVARSVREAPSAAPAARPAAAQAAPSLKEAAPREPARIPAVEEPPAPSGAAPSSAPATPRGDAAPSAQPAAAQAAPARDGCANFAVLSPLPGKILRYAVSEGQRVKRGDLLLMIEAMKMENELFAAESGVVRRIYPAVGQNVETGERLIDIEIGG